MKSMTGYGKAALTAAGGSLTVEIKSVNNRFLDINARLPRVFSGMDELVRKTVSGIIKRGTVDIYFTYAAYKDAVGSAGIDYSLAGKYISAAKELKNKYNLKNDLTASSLLKMPDVLINMSPEEDREALKALLEMALSHALKSLDGMREKEGTALRADLEAIAQKIFELTGQTALRAPVVVAEYREKLRQRIAEALAATEIDEARLANETAFFCDKADISEEISRMRSHLAQFFQTLTAGESVGRKLDFISQEMTREINTIGSKANDAGLLDIVISLKNENEKLKEQIRNVE